jgi:membrane glycosyltransferase
MSRLIASLRRRAALALLLAALLSPTLAPVMTAEATTFSASVIAGWTQRNGDDLGAKASWNSGAPK